MTRDKSKQPPFRDGEPPNPLDFPVKDPLREVYEGRWKSLPLLHKIGVTVVLGFWVVFIAALVWGGESGHHLIGLLPLVVATAILGAFLFALGRNVR